MAQPEIQVGDLHAPKHDAKSLSDAANQASRHFINETLNSPAGRDESTRKIPEDILKTLKFNDPLPLSADDLKDAQKVLDSKDSNLIPEKDQAILKSMNHAIINGDTKEFGEAIAKLNGDPARVKAFAADLERTLKESGAGVHVVVSKDGNVIAYKDGDSAGVQYNGKTGESTVVPLKNEGGNVIVENGEVLNKNAADVFHDIGQSAARNILGKNTIDFEPLFPKNEQPRFRPDTWPGSHVPRERFVPEDGFIDMFKGELK